MQTLPRPGLFQRLGDWLYNLIMSVPVHVKISGLVLLPVIVLGVSLNYWVASGLKDWLSYLLTDVRVDAAMRAGQRSVQLVTILGAVGSLLVAYLLTFLLTRPLLALRQMAQRVATGDFTARARVWSKDEIGQLATAVNTMTNHLVASQDDLALSNRHLAAINRVILAASRPAEIHDVLYSILGIVVDVLGLETGWIYLRDPERDRFHLATWYGVPDALQARLLQNADTPLCRCQQDFVAGQLQSDPGPCACQRLVVFTANPGASHISIPLASLDQRFGIINLLTISDRPVSPDDLELLRAIGAQISEIVANAWLRLKLEEKEKARQLLLEFLMKAQEEERGRLARELHDGAGQMLTSLLVRMATLEKKAESPDLRHGLRSILDMASETLEQVRELSYRLRPAALEEFGLSVALETLAHDMAQEAGLDLSWQVDLAGAPLTPEAEVTLYRIAQEALTNIVRHAQAEHIAVDLMHDAINVWLRIQDDGQGFFPYQVSAQSSQRHMGLIGMQERTEIIGGRFELLSAPGQGTRVQVQIPMRGNTR